MAEREVRERDILVAANEYAYVQDLTKGDIVLYVGPTKISLSNTERLVELRNDRFVPARGEEAGAGIHPFVAATSAQYILLENPPKDATVRPVKGSNSATELLAGRRVVVPGPATFPLWPGQRAQVIDGHRLREDEYLVVRVYDRVEGDESPIGTERIIRGSEVSFYIPRTGLEVVAGPGGYVRRARRLRKSLGLHLRVVKPFTSEKEGQLPPGSYAAGQDVFLRDREGFFFPTDQLEVIAEVEAFPLAEKEGIYVRELDTGRIDTVLGPRNVLVDPTRQELVERPLDAAQLPLFGLSRQDPRRSPSVHVPPSYAVMVTSRSRREVVRGPAWRTLQYDEELEVLALSTGRPKSDERLLSTCFLLLEGNKVSDVVRVQTADHVALEVALSYRVSFVTRDGAPERWFNVKDYVSLLCDHTRSLLRAAARGVGIEALHSTGTEILRTAVLGEKNADGKRPGRLFEENDMWIYDVEVLDVRILDAEVEKLLAGAQRTSIVYEIDRKQEELRLATEQLREQVKRRICEAQIETCAKAAALETAGREVALAKATTSVEADRLQKLGRARADADVTALLSEAKTSAATREQEVALRTLAAEVQAFKDQMGSLHPELIATLKMLGNEQLAAALTKNLAPLAILGGESVSDVAERLLGALPLGPGSDGAAGVVSKLRPKKDARGDK